MMKLMLCEVSAYQRFTSLVSERMTKYITAKFPLKLLASGAFYRYSIGGGSIESLWRLIIKPVP